MITFNSTYSLAPLTQPKFRAYKPAAHKPKSRPKSMVEAKTTASTAEPDLSAHNSSRQGGDWYDIDTFPTPDSHTSCSELGAPAPFNKADSSEDPYIAPFSEEPEYCQRTRELVDEETNHAAPVPNMNVGMDGLLHGSRRDLPFFVDDSVADVCSNRAWDGQNHGLDMAFGNGEDQSGQYGHPDAFDIQTFAADGMNGIQRGKLPPEDDTRSGDFGVAKEPTATHKRASQSPTDAITSMEVADRASVSEPNYSRPAKRWRESLIPDPVSTLELARLTPSNERSSGLSDSNTQGDTDETSDLLDEQNGGGGAHDSEVDEPLLQPPRRPSSPFGTNDQSIEPDSNRRGDTSNPCSEGVDESHEDHVRRIESVSCRASLTTSQRLKPSYLPVRKEGRNLSPITSRVRRRRTTSTTRQVPSPESRQLSNMGTHRVTQSRSQQTSVRAKPRDESNSNRGSNVNISYQIADVTLHHIPENSSIITTLVRCSESSPIPNLAALSPGILDDKVQVIRTIHVPPDSWLLLGYRYNENTPGLGTRVSLTRLEEGQKSYPHIDSANDDSVHVDDSASGFEEDEDEEGDVQCSKRKNVPWLDLDDLRLQAYVKMGMKWKAITTKFPGRTPAAVRTRWHTLRTKRSSNTIA